MADFTITHRVEAPALVDAINNLAAALSGGPVVAAPTGEQKPIQFTPKQDTPVQAAPAPVANPTPAPTAPPATPVSSVSAPTPAATPVAPENVAAPSPAAATKAVTFDEIVSAGSQLLDAGRMNDLLGLLKGFGVQAITQLKPEQYADVAVALRGLGAKI